jgi:tRNA threonylcarbamoyladenosine biosynthesis protein TsaB
VRVLAVDTTGAPGSVALADGADLVAEARFLAQDTHSRVLLPAIEFVLKTAGLEANQVEGFAVVVGPGSFTGLRVGISTVQGLALAAGRPCLGAPGLDILAASVADEAPPIVALRDAFRGEVYWATFAGSSVGATKLGKLEDALRDAPPGAAFVGDAVPSLRPAIEIRIRGARFPRFETFLAATLARWAEPRLRAGAGTEPGALRPLYVRGPDIRKASA